MGLFKKSAEKKGMENEKTDEGSNDEIKITTEVAENSEIQGNAANSEAVSGKANIIEAFDAFGRKVAINADEWAKNVLPKSIESHKDNPDALYSDIMLAVSKGYEVWVIEAAQNLRKIDPIKERGFVTLAIVYLKNKDYDQAEKTLNEYIDENGKTGTVLTNLAKVYDARGDKDKCIELLKEGLRLNPNQDNGLAWYLAIVKEKSGEEAYLNSLKDLCGIAGSYLPQTFMGTHYLAQKDYKNAKPYFDAAMDVSGNSPEILYIISGSLGKNGFIREIVDEVVPRFKLQSQDPRTAMNILHAYSSLGDYENGSKLVDELLKLNRPDLRGYLLNASNYFDSLKRKNTKISMPQGEVKQKVIAFNKPMWSYGMPDNGWMTASDTRKGRIGFLSFTNTIMGIGDKPTAVREDNSGRLTRSIPIFLQEMFYYTTRMYSEVYIPVAEKIGPVISSREWDEAFLDRQINEHKLNYLITGNISENDKEYDIKLTIVNGSSKTHIKVEEKVSRDALGEGLFKLITKAYTVVTGKAEITVEDNTPEDADMAVFYKMPAVNSLAEYLGALGQLLIQSLINSSFLDKDNMWGERNILNWYLQLALKDASNPIPYIIFVSGLCKSRLYGSEAYNEFKDQAVLLVNGMSCNGAIKEKLQAVLNGLYRKK